MRAAGNRTTDYLLVDISNSYTKLAFATRRADRRSRFAFRRSKLTVDFLRRILRGRSVGTIVVSSVVPQKNKAIATAAGSARVLFLSPKLDLGVGIDYPAPRSIGADRLANAAAVAQLYGYPAIVVDFGTAVTFDVVSARGDYVGGVIAPGLEAMTSFLYQRTALLPKLTLREPKRAIGKTTRDAMMSGAVFGYRGLVREIPHPRQPREFSATEQTANRRDGWVCAIDRAKASRNRSGPSEPDAGRVANYRQSECPGSSCLGKPPSDAQIRQTRSGGGQSRLSTFFCEKSAFSRRKRQK